jgi:hypothetical protein
MKLVICDGEVLFEEDFISLYHEKCCSLHRISKHLLLLRPSTLWLCMSKLFKQNLAFSRIVNARVYPEVSELAAWSGNSKWYNSLPLDAVVSLFFESV